MAFLYQLKAVQTGFRLNAPSPSLKMENIKEKTNRFIAEHLSEQMKVANITSFRQLAQRSGLSRYQINKIRRGEWDRLSLRNAAHLAIALNLPLEDLLTWTGWESFPPSRPRASDDLEDAPHALDYQYLENQLQQQATNLNHRLQREALQQLESWLLNWPKVVHAVHNDKPDLLAVKILPLLRPLDLLLKTWGVEAIGTIGDRLPYTPQEHRLASPDLDIAPGTPVEVQQPGYRHQGNLLFRAEVKVVADGGSSF